MFKTIYTSNRVYSKEVWKTTARVSTDQVNGLIIRLDPLFWDNRAVCFIPTHPSRYKANSLHVLALAPTHNPLDEHHPILLSIFLAQTEAFQEAPDEARTALEAAGISGVQPRFQFPGMTFLDNKQTNSFFYKYLTPWILKSLIALNEHELLT